MIKFFRLYGVLLATFFLTACLHESMPFLPEPETHYEIEGLETDEDTEKYIESIIDDRVSTPLELEKEEQQDEAIAYRERQINTDLVKAMQAQGYYQAQIIFEEGKKQASGTYKITSGPLYRIKKITVSPDRYTALLDNLPLKPGDPLKAEDVLKTQQILLKKIEKESCALTLNLTHKAILAPGKTDVHLEFNVGSGPDTTFGPAIFEGMSSIKTSYLNKLVPWQEGKCFKRAKINTLRKKLLASGLFSEADITTGEIDFATNQVSVIVKLTERAHRTVRAGLSYYTDEGPGAIMGWEHRNFFGSAEKFNADLTLSALEQGLDLNLSKPFFLRNDQTLSLTVSLSRENTDAYEKIGIGTGFRLERKFTPHLSGRFGSDLDLSRITEDNSTENTYGLLSGVLSVVFDNRDDTLDPHIGWRLNAQTEPFIDVLGESSPFIKTSLSGSTYYELNRRTVLAARTKIGSIARTNTANIPASERFYAGGGGSVRGFGYQEIGPHEGNDPVGGRSLIEASTEFRYKFTDTIGAVAFVDAGNVSDNIIPNPDNLHIGAGLGLRYHTSFGPIRFDIATPLNNDDRLDQNYQIYISIGQAF